MTNEQIIFFKKNILDLSNPNITITVTDATATDNGQSIVDFMRNRSNDTGWITTDSNDAALTEVLFDFGDERDITDILIVGHNLKILTLKYLDGVSLVDFSPVISETVNADDTTHFEFTQVSTTQIQLVISGTQVADADKIIRQMIVTEKIGQLEGWPIIKKPELSKNKKISSMLSGKANVVESVGSFSATLSVQNWNIDADLTIVENIYNAREGVLMWLSGGNESQFSHRRLAYRLRDLFFVRPVNEFQPEWVGGFYKTGMKINMQLREAIS